MELLTIPTLSFRWLPEIVKHMSLSKAKVHDISQKNLNYLGARPKYYLIKAWGWRNQEERRNRLARKWETDQRG